MQRIHRAAIAGALCLGLSPIPAHAYSALYVFGDSLSDAGNDFIGTNEAEPAAPYANGQFSNGPIWIEGLSQGLGLGPVTPALAGGNDYAFGGATTGNASTLSPPTVPAIPTLTQQVNLFLAAVGPSIPSTALYSVWIGSNDVFNIVSSNPTPLVAQQEVLGAAQTEAAAIAKLASAGAKDFLVPLVGDLGKTPTLNGNGLASAAGTALALAYNAALEADLAGLASTPTISVSYLDTFTLLDQAIVDRPDGLTNVTDACYTGNYFGVGGTVCANPNQYLFWDQLHPTEIGQQLIAQAAFDTVPEPATVATLATGLAGLAMLRRRSRRRPV
jgi:phospholipase/lecithinase/hemolysin